ncbi:hypothetical protein ARMSODRAFT_1007467 [Armillaria solidipes]|uniref:Uncharacterized protein n=1 Tax=Armillaria solidipes TaxID=1076256 RepID=A0A2H3BJA7_9AGAR|nr:hypothetical protein ARMSODRAFT_1007467 [Armillaria solidipes]
MSAAPSTLAFLKFIPGSAPSASQDLPLERPINRTRLADTAPDREDTLKSHATTIEQLRQSLRLRSMAPQTRWLYHFISCDGAGAVNNSEPVVRTSTWLDASSPKKDEDNTEGGVKSNSRPGTSGSENSAQVTIAWPAAEQPLVKDTGNDVLKAWAQKSNTAASLLISPRPLGPTHILVAFPSQDPPTAGSQISVPAQALEFPINDLLFVLNAPNLAPSPKLPRRLHQELPRVSIRVPDVETFRHLVIYLHTRNLGQLMRAIIPDWIRDLVYPLTALPAFAMAVSDSKERRKCRFREILNDVGLTCCIKRVAFYSREKQSRPKNFADTVAQELAEASRENSHSDLIKYTAVLDALRANLGFIGYYEQSLWSELDLYHDILIRAISLEAKVGQREWMWQC